jgi:hypothetical protein
VWHQMPQIILQFLYSGVDFRGGPRHGATSWRGVRPERYVDLFVLMV